jgi:HEPN domain-containing protein
MARFEELSVDKIVGGSRGQDRVTIPEKVEDICPECGLFQRFRRPSPAKGSYGLALGFSAPCEKCGAISRFFVSYPEQKDGPILAAAVYRYSHRSRFTTLPHLSATDEKIDERFDAGDFDGAITLCFTLLERLLKITLVAKGIEYKETEGDIRKLFRLFQSEVIVDVADNAIPTAVKTCLEAQIKLIGGLYEVANKYSDRHDAIGPLEEKHAKIVVQATRAVAEFIESYH